MRKYFFCLIFVLSFFVTLADKNSIPSEVYDWFPDYITFLPTAKIDSVLAYSEIDIVPVKYELYKHEIVDNSELLKIVETIRNVAANDCIGFEHVWIGGSASPDGPEKLNIRLAKNRGDALYKYLLERTGLSPDLFRVENLGEDWYTLERNIRKSKIKYKDEILEIITEEQDPDKREYLLKTSASGKYWEVLKKEIFPNFRTSRMVIVCHAKERCFIEEFKLDTPSIKRFDSFVAPPIVETSYKVKLPEIPVLETRFFAAKTNLLFGAATVANIGFEMELGRKWSIDIPFYYSPYNIKWNRKLRVMAVQPELRRWLIKAGEGHFFGVHGHLAGFNVAINDHGRYQDPDSPLWGFGLGYGYALNFGVDKHWGLEFNVGFGFANYKYDVYYNMPNGQKFDSGSGWWWGPTRAGITLTYKWWVPRKLKNREEN